MGIDMCASSKFPNEASLGANPCLTKYRGYDGLVKYVPSSSHPLKLSIRQFRVGSWPIRLYILDDQGERELSTVSAPHAVYLLEAHHIDVVFGPTIHGG